MSVRGMLYRTNAKDTSPASNENILSEVVVLDYNKITKFISKLCSKEN